MDNKNNTMNFFVPETRPLDDFYDNPLDITMDMSDQSANETYTAIHFGIEGVEDEYEEIGTLQTNDSLIDITLDLVDLETNLFGDKAEVIAKDSINYLNQFAESFTKVTELTKDLIDKQEITNKQADYIANAAYQIQLALDTITQSQKSLIEYVDNYIATRPDGTLLEEK